MKINRILEYLDDLYPHAHCELYYQNDYQLLIAVMLSAQTTDKQVNKVTFSLFDRYSTLEQLAQAQVEDIMSIIKPVGTYRKKAKNIIEIAKRLILEQNGIVPNQRQYLESLPGVGRKTTNVVLSTLYKKPVLAVDTHLKRVSIRLGLAQVNDDVFTIEKKLTKIIPKSKIIKIHHQFIFFGRYHCQARKPNCNNCHLKDICYYYKNPNL